MVCTTMFGVDSSSAKSHVFVVKNTFIDFEGDAIRASLVRRRSQSTPPVSPIAGEADRVPGPIGFCMSWKLQSPGDLATQGTYLYSLGGERSNNFFDMSEALTSSNVDANENLSSSDGEGGNGYSLEGTSGSTPHSIKVASDDTSASELQETSSSDHSSTTSMMLRNIPQCFNRTLLERVLDARGFAGCYDFVYLPAELSTKVSFGYAFINLVSPFVAELFRKRFDGFNQWSVSNAKSATVHPGAVLQGLDQHVERYRNSPLMHPSVDDEMRPATYRNGIRVPFPKPTTSVKPPRVRPAKRCAVHRLT